MITQATFTRRRASLAVGAVISGIVLSLCLSGAVESFAARAFLFYVATSGAYALMPYVRRADIPLAAMWVVLAAELAPLAAGELMAPTTVAADVAGVLMAAMPIFIARGRQVMQGDVRIRGRREGDPAPAAR
jgi:hypothetical protein